MRRIEKRIEKHNRMRIVWTDERGGREAERERRTNIRSESQTFNGLKWAKTRLYERLRPFVIWSLPVFECPENLIPSYVWTEQPTQLPTN